MKAPALDRRRMLLGTAGLLLSARAVGAGYPATTIRLIYNFSAGGPGDAAARYLAERMGAALGQQIVVDNRTGGNGAVGILAAARAKNDGYTLLFTSLPGIVQLPYTSSEKGFDPLKGLRPVGLVAASPLAILAHPSLPFNDFAGFVEWAKAQPASIPWAGAGPICELATARLVHDTGLNLQFIPYRGVAPALQALMAGEVKLYFLPPPPQLPELIKAGKLKVIATAGAAATPLVPGALPIARSVPGFVQDINFGIWAPPGIPDEIVARLQQELSAVLAQAPTAGRFLAFGLEAKAGNADELMRLTVLEAESVRKTLATTSFKFET